VLAIAAKGRHADAIFADFATILLAFGDGAGAVGVGAFLRFRHGKPPQVVVVVVVVIQRVNRVRELYGGLERTQK
jgi:hypothetical protein